MSNFWNIQFGAVLTIVVALVAVISATLIGIRQNKINENLLKLQDSVELYITHDLIPIIHIKNGVQDGPIITTPGIFIRNLSSKMVYLNKYRYNGVEYPLSDVILPPISQYNDNNKNYYHIELPTNGVTHVSFEIYFSSWSRDKWETKGYADFANGQWQVTYDPCKKSGDS